MRSIAMLIGFMKLIKPQVDFNFNPRFNQEFLGDHHRLGEALVMDANQIGNSFGQRVRSRRKALKKSQGWLAEKMEVSINAVSKWENGGDASLSNIRQIAKNLRCTVGYLAGDHDDPHIAEVVRLMEELTEPGRLAVFNAVYALHAIQPKLKDALQGKLAS